MGGIWAVDWHSLDGTSWLYFVTAGKSPFDIAEGIPVNVDKFHAADKRANFEVSVRQNGELLITPLNSINKGLKIRITALDGRVIPESIIFSASDEIKIQLPSFTPVLKVLVVQIITSDFSECYPVIVY
jgi:hypothetical protein